MVIFGWKGLITCGNLWLEGPYNMWWSLVGICLIRGELLYWNHDIFTFVYMMADLKNKVKCYNDIHVFMSVTQSVVYTMYCVIILIFYLYLIDWLIDWCFMPTLAIFQLYRGVNNFFNLILFFVTYIFCHF